MATRKEAFENAKNGEIFAIGASMDGIGGLNMTGSMLALYWIAVKGGNNDWCIYCGLTPDRDWLRSNGDKVHDTTNILNVMGTSCDKEMLARYRH